MTGNKNEKNPQNESRQIIYKEQDATTTTNCLQHYQFYEGAHKPQIPKTKR